MAGLFQVIENPIKYCEKTVKEENLDGYIFAVRPINAGGSTIVFA